eukprot:15389418-Alexandrium_andersonii.AAC.1
MLPAVAQPLPQHYRASPGDAVPPGDARTCWGSGCANRWKRAGNCWKLLETAGNSRKRFSPSVVGPF